jgi:predicted RNA methylase
VNNPVRAAHQHHREAAWFKRLAGGDLSGQHVLEVGCWQGVGAEVILDRLGAANVTAFDLDEAMVELARRRLHARRVSLSVGDVCDVELTSGGVDTVVDFGITTCPTGGSQSARSPACCGSARVARHRHDRAALRRRTVRRSGPQIVSYSEARMPFIVSISCCWPVTIARAIPTAGGY